MTVLVWFYLVLGGYFYATLFTTMQGITTAKNLVQIRTFVFEEFERTLNAQNVQIYIDNGHGGLSQLPVDNDIIGINTVDCLNDSRLRISPGIKQPNTTHKHRDIVYNASELKALFKHRSYLDNTTKDCIKRL